VGEPARVVSTTEVASGQAIAVEVRGQRIAVFNVNGTFYAIGDTCTHRGGPLSQGKIEGTTVTCPWHGMKYDIRTGYVLGSTNLRVTSYGVVVEGDDLKIEL
jgi:nitrite reductase (NADH) small subunit